MHNFLFSYNHVACKLTAAQPHKFLVFYRTRRHHRVCNKSRCFIHFFRPSSVCICHITAVFCTSRCLTGGEGRACKARNPKYVIFKSFCYFHCRTSKYCLQEFVLRLPHRLFANDGLFYEACAKKAQKQYIAGCVFQFG